MADIRNNPESSLSQRLRIKEVHRSESRWFRVSVLVVVLLSLAWALFWSKLIPAKCDHSNLVSSGLDEKWREIDINKANAAPKSLLQLAAAGHLVGADAGKLKADLTVADRVEVIHDADYSPIADEYAFGVPSIHPGFDHRGDFRFSISVCRHCGRVTDVMLSSWPF